MYIYLAGYTGATTEDARVEHQKKKLLVRELKSYWEFCGMKDKERTKEIFELERISLFLDSGAFSAATRGVVINVDDYIKFVHEWKDYLDVYANLDVAPYGGLSPEETARGTAENQRIIEAAGLAPLPVYHLDEDRKILDAMIEKYDYIAIGGAVGSSTASTKRLLDEVWGEHLVDDDGLAKIKVHGFAITSLPLMQRYPWFSVDSTTWVLTGRYGAVLVPIADKTYRVVLSDKSPRLSEKGAHFSTYPKVEQDVILEYFSKHGYTYEELAADYKKRDEMNIIYYVQLEKSWQTRPFKHRQRKFQIS